MAGLFEVIFRAAEMGYKRAKTNNIIEALDVASVCMGGLEKGLEKIDLTYLPVEEQKNNYEVYVTTTDWLKEAGVNIFEKPHKALIFNRKEGKENVSFLSESSLVRKLAGREDGVNRIIEILDLNSGNKGTYNIMFEITHMVKTKNHKPLDYDRISLISIPALEASNNPALEKWKTLVAVTRELYNLDKNDPINALKLYAEKQK